MPPVAISVVNRPTAPTRNPAIRPPNGAARSPADVIVLITPLRRCAGTVSYTIVALIGLSAPHASPSTAIMTASGATLLVSPATRTLGAPTTRNATVNTVHRRHR